MPEVQREKIPPMAVHQPMDPNQGDDFVGGTLPGALIYSSKSEVVIVRTNGKHFPDDLHLNAFRESSTESQIRTNT